MVDCATQQQERVEPSGVVFSVADTMNLNHEQIVRFLFTSACWDGRSDNAMIAGATGGCQPKSEVPAMAAAAAVEAAGGTPQREFEAATRSKLQDSL